MLRVSARCISSAGHARKVLGLSPSAATSVRELKAAFRRRALETHPDHGGSSERFREVSLAYSTLVRNLGGQPQDPSTSTSSGQSGMPEGWSPTEEEFEEEFTKWQKKMREQHISLDPGMVGVQEEAEQERRHQHEAAHAVPKFFTWRLGLRILVAYLMFRGEIPKGCA
eukprot:scaffold197740_cov32-Tisochrysis_lutea.AAC.1